MNELTCDACGRTGTRQDLQVALVGDMRVTTCVDYVQCVATYRRDVSPESYAAGLRGELLAVAP